MPGKVPLKRVPSTAVGCDFPNALIIKRTRGKKVTFFKNGMGHGFTLILTDCNKIYDFTEKLSKTKKSVSSAFIRVP